VAGDWALGARQWVANGCTSKQFCALQLCSQLSCFARCLRAGSHAAHTRERASALAHTHALRTHLVGPTSSFLTYANAFTSLPVRSSWDWTDTCLRACRACLCTAGRACLCTAGRAAHDLTPLVRLPPNPAHNPPRQQLCGQHTERTRHKHSQRSRAHQHERVHHFRSFTASNSGVSQPALPDAAPWSPSQSLAAAAWAGPRKAMAGPVRDAPPPGDTAFVHIDIPSDFDPFCDRLLAPRSPAEGKLRCVVRLSADRRKDVCLHVEEGNVRRERRAGLASHPPER
jgi:hypothetical protein